MELIWENHGNELHRHKFTGSARWKAVFCFGFNHETTVQTIRERNRGILLVLQINVPDRDLYRDRARI